MPSLARVLCFRSWLALCVPVGLILVAGCTCTPSDVSKQSSLSSGSEEVTIEVGTQPGALPVTLVLDPSGSLCQVASRVGLGKRHVLCDRTPEDLAATKLKEALKRLKREVGPGVAAGGVWVLASTARAPTARALALREPAFFSRIAVWVGGSSAVARLFGPSFWHQVGKGKLQSLVLIGPGVASGAGWPGLAERQGVPLIVLPDQVPLDDPATWAALEQEFTAARRAP